MSEQSKQEMMVIGLGDRAADLIVELPAMDNFAKVVALRENRRFPRDKKIKLISLRDRTPWRDLWIPDGGALVVSDLENMERGDDLIKLSRKLGQKKSLFLLMRPHRLEGDLKVNRAKSIIEKLQENKNAILCFDEDLLMPDMRMTVNTAFENMKISMANGLACFIEMLREDGPMKVNLDDLRDLLKETFGVINFAQGEGCKISDSVENLLSSKLIGQARKEADIGILYMKLGSAHGDLNVLHDLGTTVEMACPEKCQFMRAYGNSSGDPEFMELFLALIRTHRIEKAVKPVITQQQEKIQSVAVDEELLHLFLRHEHTASLTSKLKVPTYKRLGIKVN